MIWYVIKLIVLLPLIAAAVWGTLKFAQKLQARIGAAPGTARSVRVIETTMLSPTLKLAVIAFHDREILLATSRQGLTRLAEAPARELGE
jgi:flagellar protein FliO/FliZ